MSTPAFINPVGETWSSMCRAQHVTISEPFADGDVDRPRIRRLSHARSGRSNGVWALLFVIPYIRLTSRYFCSEAPGIFVFLCTTPPIPRYPIETHIALYLAISSRMQPSTGRLFGGQHFSSPLNRESACAYSLFEIR